MKLWGGRFDAAAAPDAEAFGASIGFDQRLWPFDIMGSVAHTRMLARQHILSTEDAAAILGGLKTVAGELSDGRLDLGAAWEDIHTRVESRLTELVGEPGGRLHTGRSRNDQVATDVRLFARFALIDEVALLIGLQDVLIELAAKHVDTLFPGYTHLQRAQPIVFGHHLLAYVEMFARDTDRLLSCYQRTSVLPLGSGALAGVPYPLDRDFTARLLGFDAVSANSLDAVSDRDFLVEQIADLALVAAHLSRLGEELVLWSSAEFRLVAQDEAYTTGSSIMPQKRNPDMAELIRGKTGRAYGDLFTILTILKAQPLAYNKDLQEDKEAFFDAVDTAAATLRIAAEVVRGLEVDTARAAAAAVASFTLATDYADYLTSKGLPFREAHEVVGGLVRLCEQTERALDQLTLAELRSASPLFQEDALAISGATAVAARSVPGGTAPDQVRSALRAARERLSLARARHARLSERLPVLNDLLDAPLDQP
jgi:argininosuccinate lyase